MADRYRFELEFRHSGGCFAWPDLDWHTAFRFATNPDMQWLGSTFIYKESS